MKKLKSYLIMNLGIVLLATGVYFFKIPNGFSTGGVTGIGTILGAVTPISPAAWIWILNIGLLLVGFIIFGKGTSLKTVYCSLMYSTLIYVFEKFLPLAEPLSKSPLLELVYAMLLTAIGSAMMFNVGASSGGTDIVALILKKFLKMDVGKCLLFSDFIVASGAFFIFGIETGLYSLLGLFAKAFIVDSVIEAINSCKYFLVITDKPDEINEYILKNLHRGATVHSAVGEYTGGDKVMIHTVCKRSEAVRLREKVKAVDPHAFIIITTSSEIIGKGFRSV
ncbi:MAG: YitT family protein [Clostridia bacterium]|nr:YitT family protein [Clostridia bacterium]